MSAKGNTFGALLILKKQAVNQGGNVCESSMLFHGLIQRTHQRGKENDTGNYFYCL